MVLAAQNPIVPLPDEIDVIADDFDLSTITTTDLIFAGVAVVGGFVLGHLAKRALRRVFDDIDGLPVMAGDVIARIVGYILMTFGLVVGLEALGFSLGLVGSLFLVIVVMVILAARPLLQDLGAGLIIQMRRPFRVGDQVVMDDIEGAVEEVSARTVRVIAVDGRRVHVPNRSVLDGTIVNLTSEGRRMTTFVAGVAYDSDLERVCEVAVDAMAAADRVLPDPAPEAFVEQFDNSTINVACRFWHRPAIQEEWAARDEAMRAVKRAFDEHGITIAFPQRVLWNGSTG